MRFEDRFSETEPRFSGTSTLSDVKGDVLISADLNLISLREKHTGGQGEPGTGPGQAGEVCVHSKAVAAAALVPHSYTVMETQSEGSRQEIVQSLVRLDFSS